jgi:hypothetical protein
MTTLDFTKENIKKIVDAVKVPIENGSPFFKLLLVKLYQNAMMTFRLKGARGGHAKWSPHSLLTLHPHWKAKTSQFPTHKGYRFNPEKWNIRGGTDGSRPKNRKYSANSPMLQASGMFRNSFNTFELSKTQMKFGTKHKLADAIMSTGEDEEGRQVLFVTENDLKEFNLMYFNYCNQSIKI